MTHHLLNNSQMREVDQRTIAGGVSAASLMERAGMAVAQEIEQRWPAPAKVLVLCGPGNNGGDGKVAAKQLEKSGYTVSVLGMDSVPNFDGVDVVVDALFGTGFSRPLEGKVVATVTALNETDIPVVAVDIATGVNGDTGEIMGVAVRASVTVAFTAKRPGHLLMPGKAYMGELVVAKIGHDDALVKGLSGTMSENLPALWGAEFAWPELDSHKYLRGHALIVGADVAMSGATCLAALAAARTSAGMVTILSPHAALPVYATRMASIISRPMEDVAAFSAFIEGDHKDAVLIGPGNEVGEATRARTLASLEREKPLVLDGAVFSSFQSDPEMLFGAIKASSAPVVLTPHFGEFVRVFSVNMQQDKLKQAAEAAAQSGAIVVLKGADTVIAAPDGRVAINANAPATLSTAGAGDVLAGMILSLLASHMKGFEAACAGVWLHSACAERFGFGLIAEDLVDMIPTVLTELYYELN